MAKKPHSSISSQPDHPEQDHLLTFIDRYSKHLADHSASVEEGKTMLQLGAKTEIVQELEKFVGDPIRTLHSLKTKMDADFVKLIDGLFRYFFEKIKQSKFIRSAFRFPQHGDVLSYGMVLSEDSFENREKAMDFLDYYNALDYSDKVDVYFQFIPANAVDKLSKVESVA